MFISSTASSALLPRHGAPALWAVCPVKVYSMETRPVPCRSPHDVPKLWPTCEKSEMSTSLKTPSRTNHAFDPRSSSATPGHSRSVPGSFSRSMIFFTASAAVMFSGMPELCPSPCPGAPSTIGSR